MGTIDGLSKDRMLAIEAASVVDGEIDGSGHLILTRYDGSTIDAGGALVAVPDASTSQKGVSELATQTETEAHTDATRAVTPASLASTIARILSLETLPGDKVQILSTTIAESDPSSSYPTGISIYIATTGSGWSLNGGLGTIVTVNVSNNRCVQTFYSTAGGTQVPAVWHRSTHTSNGGGGWTAWARVATPSDPATMGITGEIKAWTTNTVPNGWILADGTAISRTTYAALFATIGTTYGSGDGSTTFNVPDLKGRVIVGRDGSVTEFNAIGKTGGEKTHVLTTAEMPAHTHLQNGHTHSFQGTGALTDGGAGTQYNVNGGTTYGFKTAPTQSTTPTNQNTGGDGAHNNLQPYMALRYIIKT